MAAVLARSESRAMNAALKSRSFTIYQAPLTPVEQMVLDICKRAAAEGRELDSIEDMRMELGALSYSTIPGIMKRLEAKGYIERTIYQRGRTVCVVETGQCTAPPKCTVPHWRTCPDRAPSPTIQVVRETNRPIAAQIEAESRILGYSLPDFLAELVKRGWHEYLADKECEA